MRKLIVIAGLLVTMLAFAQKSDVTTTKLADGYVRVEAKGYSLELPEGWVMGKETPWGARDIKSGRTAGKLGTMTANAQSETWDSLYRTSLYFIMREEKGTATDYRKKKTKQGYEAIAFEVMNRDDFASRRYVLIKNTDGRALALSVNIANPRDEFRMLRAFERMVDTAKFD